MREFHKDSCWNWNSVMANIGLYDEKIREQIIKEFGLERKRVYNKWGLYSSTSYHWYEKF